MALALAMATTSIATPANAAPQLEISPTSIDPPIGNDIYTLYLATDLESDLILAQDERQFLLWLLWNVGGDPLVIDPGWVPPAAVPPNPYPIDAMSVIVNDIADLYWATGDIVDPDLAEQQRQRMLWLIWLLGGDPSTLDPNWVPPPV
jgi:hypothetical protein